jgi:hypothetical protein
MLQKLDKYEKEGNNIPMSFKVNDELLKYIQQAVLDLSYQNNGLYFRDLIYTHATKGIPKEYLRNTEGIPKEYPKEYLDNQGIPSNQTNQGYHEGIPTETHVKQIDTPQLTGNSINDLPKSVNDTTNSINDLPKSVNDTTKSINDLPESTLDLSQVEIINEYVPEGISATQYQMYVRRLEDENVKLTNALKVCHKALESNQKNGDLSAMLYQSEQAIHLVISWVHYHFQRFFPNQDVRTTLTDDVRKYHPNFPFYKT